MGGLKSMVTPFDCAAGLVRNIPLQPRRLFPSPDAFLLLVVITAIPVTMNAQHEPSAPISPTSLQECNAFAKAMNQFVTEMSSAHEQCLASNNKNAKPSKETNILVCSQSACQYYHDFVYGPRAADSNRETSACFTAVNQLQARQADEKRIKEQREREAERRTRESRDEVDRRNARRNVEEAQQERRNPPAENVKPPSAADELASRREALEAARAARMDQANARREAQQEAIQARETDLREQEMQRRRDLAAGPNAIQAEAARRGEILERQAALDRAERERAEAKNVLAGMKSDPFGNSKTSISTSTERLTSADPAAWKDPFERRSEKTKDELVGTAAKTFELAAKKAAERLSSDAREAALKLPSAKAAAYIRETNDVASFMKGFERVFKYYDDAVGFAKIAGAKPGEDRTRATWGLGIRLAQDAAKGGATWAIEMLPRRAASVLLGPVAWAASISLGSEETAIEPSDIISRPHDFSSEQSKEVLYRQVRSFANHGDTWSANQRDELLNLTVVVQEASKRN
jgi:hypothetical protein